MQTILGAGGAIGTLLAVELNSYTEKIRLVSRHPVKVNDTDELFQADLLDPDMTDQAIAGSEVVYLVAGLEYKIKVWEENWPKIIRSVTGSCIKHKAQLVFFDNVYMYGIDEILHMTEESDMNPPSRKGAVRKELVDVIMQEVRAGRLMALIARSADFYGPGKSNSIMSELVYNNLKKGKAANWFLDADKKHSFTFTPDAAKATALLGNTADAFNQVWHLPTDSDTLTGREFVRLFAEELKGRNRLMVIPLWMLKLMGLFVPILKEMPEMMYQYDRDYFFDSSKFESRFDLKPTKYRDGIKKIVNG